MKHERLQWKGQQIHVKLLLANIFENALPYDQEADERKTLGWITKFRLCGMMVGGNDYGLYTTMRISTSDIKYKILYKKNICK
jgi:hypothetical protein